jgi:hypothetical protein
MPDCLRRSQWWTVVLTLALVALCGSRAAADPLRPTPATLGTAFDDLETLDCSKSNPNCLSELASSDAWPVLSAACSEVAVIVRHFGADAKAWPTVSNSSQFPTAVAANSSADRLAALCIGGGPIPFRLLADPESLAEQKHVFPPAFERWARVFREWTYRIKLLGDTRTKMCAALASSSGPCALSSPISNAQFELKSAGCKSGTAGTEHPWCVSLTGSGVTVQWPSEKEAPSNQRAQPAEIKDAFGSLDPLDFDDGEERTTRFAGAASVGGGVEFLGMLASGAAQLVKKRAEAELRWYAANELNDKLCKISLSDVLNSPKKISLSHFFPRSCSVLNAQTQESYRILIWGSVREAFKADLEALPTSLRTFLELGFQTGQANLNHLQLLSALRVIESLQSSVEPAKLALDLAAYLDTTTIGSPSAVQTLRFVTRVLVFLAHHPELIRHSGTVAATALQTLATLTNNRWKEGINAIKLATQLLKALHGAVDGLTDSVRVIRDPDAKDEAKRAQIPLLVKHLADAGAAAMAIAETTCRAAMPQDSTCTLEIRFLSNAANFVDAIATRDYPRIVVGAGEVLQRAVGSTKWRPKLLSGASVVAQLANADSSDEVEKVLRELTLPIASWREKRREATLVPHGRGVSITGLVGFTVGSEHAKEDGNGNWTAAGIHLSLGVDLNVLGDEGFGTLGLYTPILNLTPFTTSPLDDGDANLDTRAQPIAQEPAAEVEYRADLRQLLSLGLYARWGIGNTPFVLAGGLAYLPAGRQVETARGSALVPVLSYSALLAVDTTLYVF